MLLDDCFTPEWIQSFRDDPDHRKIDPSILEKMIYALHLLERLQSSGLDFTFKGGTSLVLLLKEGNRFSIDIDIICNIEEREKLEAILEKVVSTSRFTKMFCQEVRSYQKGVPKAHYVFKYATPTNTDGEILLDILIEADLYPQVEAVEVATKWIKTESQTYVSAPTIDCITGDKLTAFAPNTVGIPYEKNERSATKEIIKQLFDLNKLFDAMTDVTMVYKSYEIFVEKEIAYRKAGGASTMNINDVMADTIATCRIISQRGNRTSKEEKVLFDQLQTGITAFGGFLMKGRFNLDEAIAAAGKVAYLTAKFQAVDLSPLTRYEGQDIKTLTIVDPKWNYLNKLKRFPDKSSFFYWWQAMQTLRVE